MHQTQSVPLADITPDPDQPRKYFDPEGLQALGESLDSNGLLQPISIRSNGEGYIIIAGERRYRAATALGWETIPAIIRDDLDTGHAAKLQLIENIVREDMSPLEEYRAYRRMLDGGYTVEEIAEAVGKQVWAINWHLKILEAEPEVLDLFGKGIIRATETRAMADLSRGGQLRTLAKLGSTSMTSRQTLKYISAVKESEQQGTLFVDEEVVVSPEQQRIRRKRKESLALLAECVGEIHELLAKENEAELRKSVVIDAALLRQQLGETRKALNMIEALLPKERA